MHNMCTERLHEQVSTTDTMHREVPEGIAENAFRPSLLNFLHSYEKGNPKVVSAPKPALRKLRNVCPLFEARWSEPISNASVRRTGVRELSAGVEVPNL